jgi:Helix-turn-helix domain
MESPTPGLLGTMKKNGLADTRIIPPGALKQREARAYLGGISIPTLHRLVKRGLLRPNRATRHLLFPISELDRFLRDGQ